MMVKVKNTGERKEAVHTTSGVVFLHPGQERELELTEPGAKLVEASDTLTTGGKQARKRTQKAKGADYADEVTQADIDRINAHVKENFGDINEEEWTLVSGPAF